MQSRFAYRLRIQGREICSVHFLMLNYSGKAKSLVQKSIRRMLLNLNCTPPPVQQSGSCGSLEPPLLLLLLRHARDDDPGHSIGDRMFFS